MSKDHHSESQSACLEMIVELYKQLTKILVRKAQQPDESSIDKWSLDDLEAFRCYREDISDTLVRMSWHSVALHKSDLTFPFSHPFADVLQ